MSPDHWLYNQTTSANSEQGELFIHKLTSPAVELPEKSMAVQVHKVNRRITRFVFCVFKNPFSQASSQTQISRLG
jgi:hypothetical protein